MICRRTIIAATAAMLTLPAAAQTASAMPKPGKRAWAKDVPVIRIGLLGGENEEDRLQRVAGYKKLMEETFEVPVKTFAAAD